ncbi:MAG TPA: response regulator [Thermomicrobiales bacterium]
MMLELLEGEGYRAKTYKVAEDAYRQLLDDRPSLIIVDIHMGTPESGWQLIELLRLNPVAHPTPIIVCSADAHALGEKAAHLRERDCVVLQKPFDLDDLLGKVATVSAPLPA